MLMILVVEDEGMIAELLREVLENEGYRVALAGNGQEALAQLEQVRPDLILSDMMMPVMDGLTLCRTLQQHPRYGQVPVVLMSAAKQPPSQEPPCYHAFLTKPFDLDRLLTTVGALVAPREREIGQGSSRQLPQ